MRREEASSSDRTSFGTLAEQQQLDLAVAGRVSDLVPAYSGTTPKNTALQSSTSPKANRTRHSAADPIYSADRPTVAFVLVTTNQNPFGSCETFPKSPHVGKELASVVG